MTKDAKFGQYLSKLLDNHKLSLGAGEEVTYRVVEDGTDSTSSPYTIYFNLPRPAMKVTIRATVACSLTVWNGRIQKSPITINAGVNNIEVEATQFKIVAGGATIIEVTVK